MQDPASALWWRLWPHLGTATSPVTADVHRVRPVWTGRLTQILGDQAVDRITGDRLWPVLVARVDTAARAGLDPEQLITAAATMLAPHTGRLHPHELATVLLWHIGALTDPEPVTAGVDRDVPPDPADADLTPPPDLHTRVSAPHSRAAETVAGPGVSPWPGPTEAPRTRTPARSGPTRTAPAPPSSCPARNGSPRTPGPGRRWTRRGSTTRRGPPGPGCPATSGPAGWTRPGAGEPGGWTRLVDHLHREGFTDPELLAAGLARTSRSGDRVLDLFVNRVMLPIHDTDGRLVAFVGRKHPADTNPAAPKYVNSRTTDLYSKATLPYG